jgi:replicative DNA helicase
VYYTFNGHLQKTAFNNKLDANSFLASLPEDIFDLPLNEYLDKPQSFKSSTYLFHTGVNFPDRRVSIDPYLLGYWLCNQNLDPSRITISNPELIAYFTHQLPLAGFQLHRLADNGTYSINNVNGFDRSFANSLRDLNVLHFKHIPKHYKVNSRQNRLKLLAGLIDAAGYINIDSCEIGNLNERLAKDIEYLAFSLGFMATIHTVSHQPPEPCCIQIMGDLQQLPLVLSHKKCALPKVERTTCLQFEVKSLGEGQYCGFELDGNGRFLLGDFLVTHNTTLMQVIL